MTGQIDFRLNRRAFTVIEMLIALGFVAIASIWAAQLLTKPVAVQNMMMSYDIKKMVDSGANQFTTDIQAADPLSIVWSSLPSTNSFAFIEPRFNLQGANAVSTPIGVSYDFVPAGNGMGALTRTVDHRTRVVIPNMIEPSTSFPLVQQDPTAYHMLIFQALYKPANSTATATILRRVAVNG